MFASHFNYNEVMDTVWSTLWSMFASHFNFYEGMDTVSSMLWSMFASHFKFLKGCFCFTFCYLNNTCDERAVQCLTCSFPRETEYQTFTKLQDFTHRSHRATAILYGSQGVFFILTQISAPWSNKLLTIM